MYHPLMLAAGPHNQGATQLATGVTTLTYKELVDYEIELENAGLVVEVSGRSKINILKVIIEEFFAREGAQLVLDMTKDYTAFPRLSRRASTSATIDLDLRKFGPDLTDPRNAKIARKLQAEVTALQEAFKLNVYVFACDYLRDNGSLSASRARKIYALLEILLRNTLQISEGGFLWTVLYALEASAEVSQEQFTWILSLGGDQEPPPLVEGYVLDPLQKLQALSEQQVCVLPRLLIVGTFPCHILENCQDKLGRPLNEQLHVHNSRVTLVRVLDFIHCFYPQIAKQCAILEFPRYQSHGAARTLFAGIWSCFEPEEQASMARMFRLIRGNVSLPEPTDMQNIFGEHCMPYVGRHLASNGHFIEGQHVLRFGAEHTEPQFWLASCKMRDLILRDQEQLLVTIKARLASAQQQQISLETVDAIQEQLQSWQTEKGVQGQMGMSVPALYYRHEDEPGLGEIICGAESALSPNTDELPALSTPPQKTARKGGLEKLRQTYRRLVAIAGEDAWWDFLADWYGRYLAFETDTPTVEAHNSRQQSELRNLQGYQLGPQTRTILNLDLD